MVLMQMSLKPETEINGDDAENFANGSGIGIRNDGGGSESQSLASRNVYAWNIVMD